MVRCCASGEAALDALRTEQVDVPCGYADARQERNRRAPCPRRADKPCRTVLLTAALRDDDIVGR